jgi:hypothetical protein
MSSGIEDANIREISTQGPGDANTAAALKLSLEGQGRLQETVKDTDATTIGDGNVLGRDSNLIKTGVAMENNLFATQLLGMQLARMENQIGKIPNAAV